jgi:hypothetical protein
MTTEQSGRVGCGRREIIRTLRTLISDHTLPLWSREGWDSSRGGFVERLDIVGKADYCRPDVYAFKRGRFTFLPSPLNTAGIRRAVKLR